MLHEKEKIRIKLYVKYLISKNTNYYSMYNNDKQKVVVALAADYGNLGDVAITYAQTEFLKEKFPEAEVIDFPISKTFTHMKSLKKVIQPTDIITIVGGGNTGDLYDDIEYSRQFIISQFPENKIISFPQTIDFSDTEYGEKALKKAINVYSKHKNLTVSAREEKSFEKYKTLFTENKVVFSPDIVLSLNEATPEFERKDITLVLRNDHEKLLDKNIEEKMINKLNERYNVNFHDTHIDKNRMSVKERKEELNKIWSIFKESKLVITDRLHGMIFCAITNTPCIALDNSNYKVSGVYKAWLRDNDSIEVVSKINYTHLLELIENKLSTEYKNSSEDKKLDRWNHLI